MLVCNTGLCDIVCPAQSGRLQLASLRLSICYRWCGSQWGFGSGACAVSVARVRVPVPRWNLNGGYIWAPQIHTHTLPCTGVWPEKHISGKKRIQGYEWNHRWKEQPSRTTASTFITSYICCPEWAPFTGRVVFPTLFTSSACLWVGVWMLVVGGWFFFYFFFFLLFKGELRGVFCLPHPPSWKKTQKNTHDSRTAPPHPPPPASQPASLILSQGTFQNGPAQESARQPQPVHFIQSEAPSTLVLWGGALFAF